MIRINCPHCKKLLQIPNKYAGKKGKCIGCGNYINVTEISVELALNTKAPVEEIPKVLTEKSKIPINNDDYQVPSKVVATITFLILAGLIALLVILGEMGRQEAIRQEAVRQEAVKQEAARQEVVRQEAAKQEAARQEAEKQEVAKQEAARQEAEKSPALDYHIYQALGEVPLSKEYKGDPVETLPKGGYFRVQGIPGLLEKPRWYEVLVSNGQYNYVMFINGHDLNGVDLKDWQTEEDAYRAEERAYQAKREREEMEAIKDYSRVLDDVIWNSKREYRNFKDSTAPLVKEMRDIESFRGNVNRDIGSYTRGLWGIPGTP